MRERLAGGLVLALMVELACSPTPVRRGRGSSVDSGATATDGGDAAAGGGIGGLGGGGAGGSGGDDSGGSGGGGGAGGSGGADSGGTGGSGGDGSGGTGGAGGDEPDAGGSGGTAGSGNGGASGCSDIPPWKPGAYKGGDRVSNGTPPHQYRCKDFPYEGWCGNVAYEPGKPDAPWMDAWDDLGRCP